MTSALNCCPFCRGALNSEAAWSLEGRRLTVNGSAFTFTRSEAVLFDLLWNASQSGRGVSTAALFDALYAADPNGGPGVNIISVFLSRMRRELSGTDVVISGRHGSSIYHLQFKSKQSEPA